MIKLGFGVNFNELSSIKGLQKLDNIFVNYLRMIEPSLAELLITQRSIINSLSHLEYSEFLISLAPIVEKFLIELFDLNKDYSPLFQAHLKFEVIYQCKRQFVQRIAIKKYSKEQASLFNINDLEEKLEILFKEKITEEVFSKYILIWDQDREKYVIELDTAERYAAYQVYFSKEISLLFSVPQKKEFNSLIDLTSTIQQGLETISIEPERLHNRDGFKYTGGKIGLDKALDAAHYCIYCHKQDKDSCSKGLKFNSSINNKEKNNYKLSEGGVSLQGCPLEQKISEMNFLKSRGFTLGALAVIIIDNPLALATGNRICNDCMKSCIFQKQEPVDIPKIETQIINDVLNLPYGFEVYNLLTKWNPLNLKNPLPKLTSNYKILVAGLGPAGFTLAYYLLREGHMVVGIDGLKIEPLPTFLEKNIMQPIKWIKELWEELDIRKSYGFGGVMEYGITVRFDKNYLTLIRIILEREKNFKIFGGVRLGSNITFNQAFELGFDHIALCLGAGKPKLLEVTNGLAKGARTASDFLMALQLNGAARKESISNLTIRLPIAVIGGGLTSIDTASEALAYYPIQVEKFLSRYEILASTVGLDAIEQHWSEEDKIIATEFLTHAKMMREERRKAQAENREPNIRGICNLLGGATIYYRKSLLESPAYKLNHEEVEYALQEGIKICSNNIPLEFKLDEFSYINKLVLKNHLREIIEVPARTVLMAAGTYPNTKLAEEEDEYLKIINGYFSASDINIDHIGFSKSNKYPNEQFITSVTDKGSVSFFGDLHPTFAGNVVKAMASAKNGYPHLNHVMLQRPPKQHDEKFLAKIEDSLIACIHEVKRLTPNIIEIILYAPLASQNFKPGQFYRLQNYENDAQVIDNLGLKTILATEGLALTGSWVEKEKGLISTIILEMGGSSKICQLLKPGQKVILLGPTGAPTELKNNEIVLLAGGGLGNAVLFSIGKALRVIGCKVVYFAAYRKAIDRFKIEEIHEAADIVVWCCEEQKLPCYRDQDWSFEGNIVEALKNYGELENKKTKITLREVDKIIAIGSHKMMEAINIARHTVLAKYLKNDHIAVASINSPMQCMIKEICGQCLQKHIDPVTGKEHYIYSCSNQDQNMNSICFKHLNSRLEQNSLQEKLTNIWVDEILK